MSDIQEIKVPALGESVTEATIARWLKKEGDQVAQDEPLVELETDKVTLEVMAPATGKIEKIIVAAGQTVEVGAILGSINGAASAQTSTAASIEPATSAAPPSAETKNDKPSNVTASQPASGPAARKMMDENNLSANDITGSAKDGRISKGDVIAALSEPKQSASPAPSAASNTSNASGRLEERVPMTRLRQRIAQRLKEAQNTAAILTTFNEVDMTAINAIRATYKDSFAKKYDIKLGFMSFFVKATIQALKEIPSVNAQIDGTDIVYKNYCDIGVAISAPQGLIVPIIRDAQNLSFADIERIIVEFGEKAKNNKLSIEELSGGTFSISNGGTFGSLMSTPILNPPQSAILGMHKIQDRAMVIDGKIEIRPMMYLALSYDHRLIDGREAVTFLKRIKECIEAPERLLFDV